MISVNAAALMTIATLIAILTQPARAFNVRPDKTLTGGSVRTGDRQAACGHALEHRGPMSAARRDEVLRRYGFAPSFGWILQSQQLRNQIAPGLSADGMVFR